MQPTERSGRIFVRKVWHERKGFRLSMVISIFIVFMFLSGGLNGITWSVNATPVSSNTITIGTSTANYQKEPFDISYRNHCDAALYTSSEIKKAGVITDLSWQRQSANADKMYSATVYMREVSDPDLSSNKYDTVTELQDANSAGTLVWFGNLTLDGSTTGWYPSIHLTTPFVYSGKQNLLISFRHHSYLHSEQTNSYYYYTSAASMFRTGSSDTNPPTIGAANGNRPNIQIVILPNMSPGAPVLKSPMDCVKLGDGANSTKPMLTWFNPPDNESNPLHFNVQVSTTPDFGETITVLPGNTSWQRAPLDIVWNYHANAGIYTQSEVGGKGKITQIRWYRSLSEMDNFNSIKIYIKHTNLTSFSSNPTWNDVVGTEVYSGTLDVPDPSTTGWFPTITLTTPFEYNGADNLLLCARSWQGNGESGSSQYQYYTTSSYQFAKWGWTTNTANPTLTRSYNRPNIQFEMSKLLVDKDSSVNSTGFSTVPATTGSGTSSYTLQSSEALTSGETYYWRVRAKDQSGTELWGPWSALLYEDFTGDSSVLSDWMVKDGTWSVNSGALRGQNGNISYTGADGRLAIGWKDYILYVKENDITNGTSGTNVGQIALRLNDISACTYFVYQKTDGALVLAKKSSAGLTQNSMSLTYKTEKNYKIEVTGVYPGGVKIRIAYDGNVVTPGGDSSGWWTDLSANASGTVNSGTIGFRAESSTAEFDNIHITPGVYSFTVDTASTARTWLQTHGRQFSDRDILKDTMARSGTYNDVVLFSEGIIAGTGTSSRNSPFNIQWNYHVNGAMYTPSQIGKAGQITKLSWYRSAANADTLSTVTVYMKETTDSDLTGTNYDTCSELQAGTLVWSGNLSLDSLTKGWYPAITLSTPFTYTGTKNVIVSVRHQDGSYESSRSDYDYTSTSNMYRDGSSDSSNPPTIDSPSGYLPNIKFEVTQTTGTVISSPIDYSDCADPDKPWGQTVQWTETLGGGTSDISVKVQYWTGTGWSDIAGKASSDPASPIDLTDLDTSVYGTIRLYASLAKGTGTTPELEDWSVSLAEPNFPFETNVETASGWLHGKTSGTDSWAHGVPTGMPGADHTRGSGNTKCWGASLAGTPSANSVQWLRAPVVRIPGDYPDNMTVQVSFWQWYRMGAGEYGIVEYSSDNNTWVELKNLSSNSDSNYRYERTVFDVNVTSTPNSLQMRFRLVTDASSSGTEWYIDDYRVSFGVEIKTVHSYDSSTTDEYIELWNYGTTNISLDGWTLSSGAATVNTFGSSDYILGSGTLKTVCTSGNDFTDAGDIVLLKDSRGKGIDFIRYGTATGSSPGELLWTGTNPAAPASTSQYLYRHREGAMMNVDTHDGADWALWKDTDGDGLPDWWEDQYGLDKNSASGDNGASGDPDHDGIWNIDEFNNDLNPKSNRVSHSEVDMKYSLVVPPSGKLFIDNSTIKFNGTSSGNLTFKLPAGSAFYGNKTSFESANGSNTVKYEVYGKLRLYGTSVKDIWGNATSGVGGFYVNTDDVAEISGSVIGVGAIGLNVEDSAVVLRNVSSYALTQGIIADNSALDLFNISITSNEVGLKLDDTDLNMLGVSVSTSNNALNLSDVTGQIKDSSITSTDDAAVFLTGTSVPDLINVTLKSTEKSGLYLNGINASVEGCTMISENNASLIINGGSPAISSCSLFGYNRTLYIKNGSTPILTNVHYQLSKVYVEDIWTDNDNDGIPDMKEIYRYKMNTSLSNASEDTDGDGISNIAEVDLYDTDPLDALDPLDENNITKTWGELGKSPLSAVTANISEQKLLSAGENSLYLVYVMHNDSGDFIVYQHSSNNGLNWSEPSAIVSGPNVKHISPSYDGSTGGLSVAWEEDNYCTGKPDTVVKYISAVPQQDEAGVSGGGSAGLGAFSYPVFLYDYSTSAFENCTSRSNINVTDNEVKLNYTLDSPTLIISSYNKSIDFTVATETFGQTFTVSKSFNKVGLSAYSENPANLYLALYNDTARSLFIGYYLFANITASQWYDFTVPLQGPGTYYLEWSTDNATNRWLSARALDPGTYSGGTGYHNGISQSYDFLMRYYTVSYDSSGTLISDRTELEYSTDTMVVSWSSEEPAGTSLAVQVSVNNGSTWLSASNGQLLTFTSGGKDLKYKFEFSSSGARTPVVRWVEISRSIVDYGKNPSLVSDGTNIYLAYQQVSYNHTLSKNITFANSTNSGNTWSEHSFSGSSVNENGIPKLVRNANGTCIIWLNSTTGAQGLRSVFSNGTTWGDYALVTDTSGITDAEGFSVATKGSNVYLAYSSSISDPYYKIYTQTAVYNGTGLVWGNAVAQTPNSSYQPQISVDSLNHLYITWNLCNHNIWLKIVSTNGTQTLLDNTQVRLVSGTNNYSKEPSIAIDSNDAIHLAWSEKLGSSYMIKYWNNTPTSAGTMASTVNNYISYLPVSAFTNTSVASGQKVALMTALQNDAQAIESGQGEFASNRLTYQDMTKVVSQGGSQAWVASSFAENIMQEGNALCLYGGIGVPSLCPPIVVIPEPILTSWQNTVLTCAYRWSKLTMGQSYIYTAPYEIHWLDTSSLGKGFMETSPESQLRGSFDRGYWNSLYNQNLFDFFPDEGSNNKMPNPGVNPYLGTCVNHQMLKTLAWLYTTPVLPWESSDGTQYTPLYGDDGLLEYIIQGFSFWDRSKESNMYWIKHNAWVGTDYYSEYSGYDWICADSDNNNRYDIPFDAEYDEETGKCYFPAEHFTGLEGYPCDPISARIIYRNPYSSCWNEVSTATELAEAWLLLEKTSWVSSTARDRWFNKILPSPTADWNSEFGMGSCSQGDYNSWDTATTYDPKEKKYSSCSELSAREIIYRDLVYLANYASYLSDAVLQKTGWFSVSNQFMGIMAFLYEMYTLAKYRGDTEKANQFKTSAENLRDIFTDNTGDMSLWYQSKDGFYPEVGNIKDINGKLILATGPSTGYSLISAQFLSKYEKYRESVYGENQPDKKVKDSVNRFIDWVKYFIDYKYMKSYDSYEYMWDFISMDEWQTRKNDNWNRMQYLSFWQKDSPIAERIHTIVEDHYMIDMPLSNQYQWRRIVLSDDGNKKDYSIKPENFMSYGGGISALIDEFINDKPRNSWSNTKLPYELYDSPPVKFYNMGPRSGTSMNEGTLNGNDPDVIVFNDGQNYNIMMNYDYHPTPGVSEMRGYSSRQTVISNEIRRPYSNGNPGDIVLDIPYNGDNGMVNDKYDYRPDYWTSSGYTFIRPGGGPSSNGVHFGDQDKYKLASSQIYQDAYADEYRTPILAETEYSLGFWAFCYHGQLKASIQWYVDYNPYGFPVDKIINPSFWDGYSLTAKSPDPTAGNIFSARITFYAYSPTPGGLHYSIVSTTNFARPGGIS